MLALFGVLVMALPLTGPATSPAAASTPKAAASASKPRPSVTLSGGTRLRVDVNPNLSGSKSWKFRLDRRSGGKWRKVGTYRTKGRSETRSLKVKAGTYRVHVYARTGYRAVTSARYSYSPSAANPGARLAPGAWWAPTPGIDWQWQLSGTIDTSVSSPVFDVDGEGTSAATVATLHAKGAHVICYFSAGSYEPGRSDASAFPQSVLGYALEGWPDERWLDVRRLDVLLPIMERRIADCRDKGFDAVEPDNVDGYANATGFPIAATDQLAYNRAIAELAHRYGLGVGLKNDPAQVVELQPSFDFAVVEECARYSECGAYAPFSAAGKAVLHVEYEGTLASFCPVTKALGFSSMLKRLELDAWRSVCP